VDSGKLNSQIKKSKYLYGIVFQILPWKLNTYTYIMKW